MKLRKIILLLLLPGMVAAQEISREVTTPAGDRYSNSDYIINWTLGETVSETMSDGSLMLTHGFQQGSLVITRIDDPDMNFLSGVDVFPNPVTDYVNVKFSDISYQAEILLYDLNGKLLKREIASEKIHSISFEDYSSGTYILRINSVNQKHSANFKIIKNQ
jgi:hypothetical protein